MLNCSLMIQMAPICYQ